MSSATIRTFMNLMEYGDQHGAQTYRDLDGRQMNQNISYTVEPSKVVAHLQSYNSAIYTNLAKKVNQVSELEKQVKQLKEEIKQEGREHVADLFSAEDTVNTRVVETVSFIFTLTKDPKATTTFKYAEIIKELETKLTPELITVLEELKAKYQSTTQKVAALSIKANESVINEGVWDTLRAYFVKFKDAINKWANTYDSTLHDLKAKAERIANAPVGESTGFMRQLANK